MLMVSPLTLLLVFLATLAVGVVGYRMFCGLGWEDALLNASLILGGMGPNKPVDRGRVFVAGYALFCGLIFIIIFAALLVRMLRV
jgi:hypothetical protein